MDSAIVNVGGEELELRPISARQYLTARMEAELMGEAFGEDNLAKSVLLGASLLAKGLFFDNERVFSSMEDVLDAMSADEIVIAAGYIDLEPDMKTKIVKTMDKIKAISEDDKSSATKVETDALNSSGFLRRGSTQESSGSFAVYPDSQVKTSGFYSESSISPRSDMRRVSDFFQRDSRRYDGIISSY